MSERSEVETSVIASCLLDPSVIALVAGTILPGDWTVPGFEVLWSLLLAMSERGDVVDAVTVATTLQSSAPAAAQALGGWSGILSLTDRIPTVAHVESHARIVADAGRVRRLALAAQRILGLANVQGANADAVEAEAHELIRAASIQSASKGVRYRAVMSAALEKAFLATQGKEPVASTGIASLDHALVGGARQGELVVLAARPAMGKSALAWQWAEATAAQGLFVVFVSLEMSGVELGQRTLAARSGVSLGRIRAGSIDAIELDQLGLAEQRLVDLPLEVHDVCDDETTVAKIRSIVANAKAKAAAQGTRLGLVVIDYLQLMSAPTGKREENREREVAQMSRGLKLLAKSAGVPIIILAQLNRKCEERSDKRPQLSDLRESGALEQDANTVIFLYRDEVYHEDTADRGIAEAIIAKQRGGPPGQARMRWIREQTRFADIEREMPATREHHEPVYRVGEWQ